MESGKSTLNAKVAGISLVTGAVALHVLNQFEHPLQPMRLAVIGVLVMGAWAFSDEMGLRKPLNRAGLVCFIFSMLAFAITVLEPDLVELQKYYLLYSFTLLFSMLIWSMAFLHRQKDLKLAGAAGTFASLLPLLVIIIGHLSVGAGALFGIQSLLNPTEGVQLLVTTPVRVIEAVFIVWCCTTAIFLWKGRMKVVGSV